MYSVSVNDNVTFMTVPFNGLSVVSKSVVIYSHTNFATNKLQEHVTLASMCIRACAKQTLKIKSAVADAQRSFIRLYFTISQPCSVLVWLRMTHVFNRFPST